MKMRKQSVLFYIIVSFVFSWAIALIIYVNGGFATFGNFLPVILLTYMCGPMVGALFCVWRFEKGRRFEALGLRVPQWREMPWAWIGGLSLIAGALLITVAMPSHELVSPAAGLQGQLEMLPGLSDVDRAEAMEAYRQPVVIWIMALSAILMAPMINGVLTLSEELGWRGYLWDQIKHRGFWPASLMTGLLWGVWHMPVIWLGHNYPDAPIVGSLVFIILCILMSPLYSWVRIKTDSVWGAGLLHGTTNSAAGFFILLQSPVDAPWTGLVGIGGFIAAGLSVAAIWAVWRRERPVIA